MIFILKYSFQHRPSTHQPHNSCKYTPFPIDTQQSWHFFIKKTTNPIIHIAKQDLLTSRKSKGNRRMLQRTHNRITI